MRVKFYHTDESQETRNLHWWPNGRPIKEIGGLGFLVNKGNSHLRMVWKNVQGSAWTINVIIN